MSNTRGVRWNFAASVGGRAATALSLIVFVPIYVRLLGVEAYGLIGLFTALQSTMLVVDLGMSSTLTRELARAEASPTETSLRAAANLVRTLEAIFWLLTVLAAMALAAFGPIAPHWIHAGGLDANLVRRSFFSMAPAVALQLPFILYQGALLGLQRHVELNVVVAAMAVLRGLTAIAVLRFVDANVINFFLAQTAVSIIQIGALRAFTSSGMRQLTGAIRGRFEMAALRQVATYAVSLAAITATSAVLMQEDKLILSRATTLTELGYYALAAVLAQSLFALSSPMFAAVFPRFSQLVAADRDAEARDLYARAADVLAVLLVPVITLMLFFPAQILRLWTNDQAVASHSAVILQRLAGGSFLLALLSIPFALQLAHGWTSFSLQLNVAQLLLYTPAVFLLASWRGGAGVAAAWLTLNAVAFLIVPIVVERKFGLKNLWRWYGAVLLPLAATAGTAIVLQRLLPVSGTSTRSMAALQCAFIAAILLIASVAVSPTARRTLRSMGRAARPAQP